VVDPTTHLLYVGTGTNYTVPAGVCETPTETGCTPPEPGDHLDSVLALDLATGGIRWAKRTEAADVWLPLNPAGPDYDFGSGPNLLNTTAGGRPRQLLGIGQKSGVYWALDPVTGAVVWHTQVGPGSIMGGMQWGSATDGKRIYVAIGDLTDTPYRLGGSGPYAGETIAGGSWGALDPSTGNILWQTPDPQGAIDIGFVSTANGVVYAGSDAGTGGNMYALDGGTGQIRWSFASGGSVVSGPAILNGVLFWGSGYWWGDREQRGVRVLAALMMSAQPRPGTCPGRSSARMCRADRRRPSSAGPAAGPRGPSGSVPCPVPGMPWRPCRQLLRY
jgi:polyvinyl alcohol dehydrogenase (cytochrome)